MTTAVFVLFASGVLLVFAGSVLTSAADAIAARSGIGRLWIGSVMLAGATSLPELATDVSAVRLGAPDLAAGDLFGSTMANMMILALLGLVPPSGRIFREATAGHAMTACLAIALNALAGAFILFRVPMLDWPVGPESVLLLAGFLAGIRVVYTQRQPPGLLGPDSVEGDRPEDPPLRSAALRFAMAALAILMVAPVFASAAERIAQLSGLGSTFIGTWLVGLCTSLPEVVTCLAALRIGAPDLAIGNLFGSNACNMAIFFAMDLAHPGGSVFAVLDPSHALSALLGVALMALGLAAIILRGEGRLKLLEPGSALILLLYLAGLWALYLRAAGPGA